MVDFDDLGVSPAGLPLLADLVHERAGLFFDAGRIDRLADQLAPLVLARGFRSFLDLYYLLKHDARSGLDTWPEVIDALSVQETYFWREVDQIRGFACRILPELVKANPYTPIRVWSAPCATGEEPLTIAMVLEESGWFDRAAIEIHASDASSAAIRQARAARYRARSFRALPEDLRERYFVETEGLQTPVESLQARVTSWSVVNLAARDELELHARRPVVFCRNAFIYFSPRSVKLVVDALADLMPAPGYLFVGASESLLRITDRFRLQELDGAFVYVRDDRGI